MAANIAAPVIAFAPFAIQHCPSWLSESSGPTTTSQFAYGLFWAFVLHTLVRAIWLLPVCVAVQFAMTRTRPRGMPTAIRSATLVSLGAIVSLLPLLPMTFRTLTAADWLRRVPTAIAALLFVAVWFGLSNARVVRSSDIAADIAPEAARAPPTPAARMVTRWLLLPVAMAWLLGLGVLGGAFMDFGGDGDWRHESSVLSPQGNWRADIVVYLEPGGALTGTASEVYVLPVARQWSPRHRGLLIWRARSTHVDRVIWESDRVMRVRAAMGWHDTVASVQGRAHAFARNGFSARTEVVASKELAPALDLLDRAGSRHGSDRSGKR
jgi:hypothetical protein